MYIVTHMAPTSHKFSTLEEAKEFAKEYMQRNNLPDCVVSKAVLLGRRHMESSFSVVESK